MKTFVRSFLALSIAISILVAPWIPLQAASAQEVVLEHLQDWEMQKGDWIIVNVADNTLQYVREDHSDMSEKVRIGSGKILAPGKKFNYLGMSYDPKTPEKVWEIRSKNQQNWYNVFGSKEAKEQLFLRLYEVKGDQRIRTYYGIHTTPELETIFKNDAGFGSWGCVLARYDLLKNIEELYELNDNIVRVVTTRQEPEEMVALLKAF